MTLAFVGDSVYESLVREWIVSGGERRVKALHATAVQYVSAKAQSACYEMLLEHLSTEEADILRRGRNANGVRVPKSSTAIDYRRATAVEALMGYLHLSGDRARLRELVGRMIEEIDRQTGLQSEECIGG